MAIATSTDVFFDQLKDLKSATEQVDATLPDLAGWATDSPLQKAFTAFQQAVEAQRAAIDSIFRSHGKDGGDDVCKAVAGLIEGGNKHIEIASDPMIRDLLLIAHSNRLGHYLVAASEFTLAIATNSGLSEEVEVVGGILQAHEDFLRELGGVAERTFEIKLGRHP